MTKKSGERWLRSCKDLCGAKIYRSVKVAQNVLDKLKSDRITIKQDLLEGSKIVSVRVAIEEIE